MICEDVTSRCLCMRSELFSSFLHNRSIEEVVRVKLGKSIPLTSITNLRRLFRITFQSFGAGIAPKLRMVVEYK